MLIIRAIKLRFKVLNIFCEPLLKRQIHVVRYGIEMASCLIKPADVELDARQMNVNSFPFDLVMRGSERVCP